MLDNPMLDEVRERNYDRGSPLAGYRTWYTEYDEDYEIETIEIEIAKENELKESA